ncbi:MAG: hypothetical protein JO151_17645 [Verrucomicrobia bacterium]|nr:hypothetical protein [Verrucomicrobiota bacterium]
MNPTPHPKPWQSQLWPHVELIRRRRLARVTWAAIAEELRGFGVAMSPQAIGRFFKRSRASKLPLGLEQADVPQVNPLERSTDRPKRITAAELLKPLPKENGLFAKWYEQHGG